MLWALAQNNPQGWLEKKEESLRLIEENDGSFKRALDRYKYPNRFPDEDCSDAREKGAAFLVKLEGLLEGGRGLLGDRTTLSDVAIFPLSDSLRMLIVIGLRSKNYQHFSNGCLFT